MSKTRYFAVRLVHTVFLIWLVVSAIWLFFRLMPGSYTDFMLFQGAGEEAVEAFRESWGLDDPLYVQYLRYLENVVNLNMGTSIQYREPVVDYVAPKIFNSFILIAPAITLAYVVGSIAGSIIGTQRGTVIEKYGIIPLIFIGSFPAFFSSMILVIIFASGLNLFPTSGLVSPTTPTLYQGEPWWRIYFTTDFLKHLVLPFTAVFLRYLYLPSLVMRTSIVEVLGSGFIYYHRITGLSTVKRLRQLAKHASLPVLTLYPISMSRSLGGLVLIESVFNWPGIGFALVNAVSFRDFPVAQFVFILIAIFIIIANMAVDILYGVIDPRVSFGDRSD